MSKEFLIMLVIVTGLSILLSWGVALIVGPLIGQFAGAMFGYFAYYYYPTVVWKLRNLRAKYL